MTACVCEVSDDLSFIGRAHQAFPFCTFLVLVSLYTAVSRRVDRSTPRHWCCCSCNKTGTSVRHVMQVFHCSTASLRALLFISRPSLVLILYSQLEKDMGKFGCLLTAHVQQQKARN